MSNLRRYHLLPPLIATFGIGGGISYVAAAIGGFTDVAGHHNRLLSALSGLVCMAIGVPVAMYIALWLQRPELPREPTLRELTRDVRRRRRGIQWVTEGRQYPPPPTDATRWQRVAHWLKTN